MCLSGYIRYLLLSICVAKRIRGINLDEDTAFLKNTCFFSIYRALLVVNYVALPGPLCPGAKRPDLRQCPFLIYLIPFLVIGIGKRMLYLVATWREWR